MHHFFEVLRNYCVFTGRAGRSEFWCFTLFYGIALMTATFVDLLIGSFDVNIGFGLFGGSFFIATLLPMLGVHVRRLHDTGRSGWWVLLGLVPAVGSFALFILVLFASQAGTNGYGPDPRPLQGAVVDASRTAVPTRNRRWLKRAAVLAALTLVAAGCVRYVWAVHGDGLVATGKAAVEEGRQAGLSLGESGCLADALRRHGGGPVSLASIISNDQRLSGCLAFSRIEAHFCEGVPAEDEILAVATWANAACTLQGLSDALCPSLFQSVVRYCASADRARKSGLGSLSSRPSHPGFNPA